MSNKENKHMSPHHDTAERATQTVVASFATRGDADERVTSLLNVGFRSEDVGVLEPADARRLKKPARRRVDWSFIGAIVAAVTGGLMGAFVGLPDIILTIVSAVAGIGLGAYAGGILGGLLGGEDASLEEPSFLVPDRAGEARADSDVEAA